MDDFFKVQVQADLPVTACEGLDKDCGCLPEVTSIAISEWDETITGWRCNPIAGEIDSLQR